MYDGEGEVAWPVLLYDFLSILDEDDGCFDKQTSMLLAYTLRKSPLHWLCILLVDSMLSLEHFYDLIEDTFHHFDPKPLDKKLLEQRKALQESPDDFWQRFLVLQFKALKSQMQFQYLIER